ncbi:MAG: aconitate hydratase AcnA [Chloroflexi bacterium HGW-Chloroflexi-1]|nr:MAG: aconitate hydratase AcnA [Chloroflexi bacterium HGW-Chloroflexi-1]
MTDSRQNPFSARTLLAGSAAPTCYYRLSALEEAGVGHVARLPFSIKVLLEALLRQIDGFQVIEQDVIRLANWDAKNVAPVELPFKPARVILQDFSGVPAVVDLAAMRSAMARLGGDPSRVNPQIPVDLVIDHSVQIDQFGSRFALFYNAEREFERNRERYEFLKWGQGALDNFRVVPPATGIVHQVNLEYLASVVRVSPVPEAPTRNTQHVIPNTQSPIPNPQNQPRLIYPDSVVGADSHTTMINGLGVLGWGVGGIEAEAVMLGQPIYMLTPEVIGFKLVGELPEGATATDLVLTVTQMLRARGVVGKFVEYYGPGVAKLSLPDRATIANMAPDYGATMGFFPVDAETLNYLRGSGRDAALVDLVERYCKAQDLFRAEDAADPIFTDTLTLDMSTVQPSLAGPKRPQDRVLLGDMPRVFQKAFPDQAARSTQHATRNTQYSIPNTQYPIPNLQPGAVVIAAITSCTNTSNPSVMVAAGLLAKKAVARGLKARPWVKTSLAPGSRVVTRYLDDAGLTPYLEALGFHTVGYGCTSCIGNSGPLPEAVAAAIERDKLIVAAVLSGNRNFEGRIHPLVQANYLASPPLVVAYALAGAVDIDLTSEPLGYISDSSGRSPDRAVPVYLRDLWPTQAEIQAEVSRSLRPELFRDQYADVFTGNETWNQVAAPGGELYAWDPESTYIQEPPFFVGLTPEPAPLADIRGARVLAFLGDSVTTDHISPAGSIEPDSPAGRYLLAHGVEQSEFNSYGSRRGNHDVLMRGAFANIRIKNRLASGVEGGYTVYQGSGGRGQGAGGRRQESGGRGQNGQVMPIYDAAMKYVADGTPLIVIAGKEYGAGSSRDWAAKGPSLLGVKAAIAESFERIHRSNLVGMGVLPLQFLPGENVDTLGLTGAETYDILGLADGEMQPQQRLTVSATDAAGMVKTFQVVSRIDTPVEVEYYRNGGILQTVLRQMLKA